MIAETNAAALAAVPTEVLSALRTASAKTGSDFDYLLATARRESSLDSHAKSKSSSATGLFQFIDQTWLGLVKQFGERHGLGAYAGAIRETTGGHFTVSSPDAKAAILALRQNPTVSALMAGESANETKRSLQCTLGRDVCAGELYAAHFLGPGGARQLIETNQTNPNARADSVFPQAAEANRGVFYHADGTPKSVSEVYAWAVNIPGEGAKTSAPAKPANPAQLASNAGNFSFAPLPNEVSDSPRPAEADRADKFVHLRGSETASDYVPAAAVAPRTLPQSPLLLTPGIMEILAAISPANLRRAI